jgi:hypothetical protein
MLIYAQKRVHWLMHCRTAQLHACLPSTRRRSSPPGTVQVRQVRQSARSCRSPGKAHRRFWRYIHYSCDTLDQGPVFICTQGTCFGQQFRSAAGHVARSFGKANADCWSACKTLLIDITRSQQVLSSVGSTLNAAGKGARLGLAEWCSCVSRGHYCSSTRLSRQRPPRYGRLSWLHQSVLLSAAAISAWW